MVDNDFESDSFLFHSRFLKAKMFKFNLKDRTTSVHVVILLLTTKY